MIGDNMIDKSELTSHPEDIQDVDYNINEMIILCTKYNKTQILKIGRILIII